MGLEKDLPPGEKIVICFRPFLEHLVSSDLSPKTIQKHVDKLWVLGGGIIRDLSYTPSLRTCRSRNYSPIWSKTEAPCSITATRKSSKDRLSPPAGSFAGFSQNRPPKRPQISLTRQIF
jgi:hypothetical protein